MIRQERGVFLKLSHDPLLKERIDAMSWAARSAELVTPVLLYEMI